MKINVDEDMAAGILVRLLQKAGHDVDDDYEELHLLVGYSGPYACGTHGDGKRIDQRFDTLGLRSSSSRLSPCGEGRGVS